jgi:F420-dependent oxidoreductase-like protein
VKLGVSLAYWPWFEVHEQFGLARLADELGYHSVWVAEGWGQEATAVLGSLAAITQQIKLGASIFQIPARQPTTAAVAASTIDRLSNGRMLMGLGLSGPQVSEGWYGVPFTYPLGRTREYIEIVRQVLSGDYVTYRGKHWELPLTGGGTGLGKPLRITGRPVQPRIPIYLGVSGERTVEQAGALADGWLPFLFSPQHAALLTEPLRRGLAKSGRSRSEMTIAPTVPAAVHDDVDTARDLVRPMIAMYLGAMGAKGKNFYVEIANRYGHGESANACQDAFLAGNRAEAEAAVSDELIDLVSLATTPENLESRLQAFVDADVDLLIVVPFGDGAQLLKQLSQANAGTNV